MTTSEKHLFTVLVFLVLLLAPAIACGNAGSTSPSHASFTTYSNDDWGCAISYPQEWDAQVATADKTCLMSSPTGRGSVRLDIMDALPAQQAAQGWLMALGTAWNSVTRVADVRMEGLWDWYLSYDYNSGYGEFHGEAYFKETETRLYKVDTAGEKAKYDTYPFDEIISTFELLPEQSE